MRLLALLLLPLCAAAAPQGPSSGTCGIQPPFGVDAQKAFIQQTFEEVRALAPVDQGTTLQFVQLGGRPNVFAVSRERAKETFGVELESDHGVLFDLGYCDFLHDRDQLANVLAHELAHIANRHEPRLRYLLDQAEEAKADPKEHEKRLDKFYAYSNVAESQADRDATKYLSDPKSRFRPGANEFREISMALKLEGKDPEVSSKSHPKLSDRDQAVKFWAAVYTTKP